MEPIIDSVVYVIPQPTSNWLTELATPLSAIAAIASVIVACVAVNFTRKQVKMHEQHNKLMAKPHLSGWTHVDQNKNTFSYEINNSGLGPAIIKKISLLVDGEEIQEKGPDLIENATEKLLSGTNKQAEFEMFTTDAVIPSGKTFKILHIYTPDNDAQSVRDLFAERTKLLIKYESIFGEDFYFDSEIH